jgi:DNA-binding SARP family transcriptional activator/Tfp pilus assembly protein PilF
MNAWHDEPLAVKLLGPVTAWRGGREIRLGTPRQRAVLAVLAVRANQAVSRSALIDAVWGNDPPSSAANGVHVYIGGLRRALEPDRALRGPAGILLTTAVGYQLRLGPRQLDAWQFEDHLAAGRRARDAGDLAGAVKSLDAAMGLWIADPLAGVPGPWAEVERTRLGELLITAYEERIDALLRLGNHGEATAALAALVREYPLRERFHHQWMLALYRGGRQAEALAAFADARRILADELGIDPGAELRRLHEQILAADPALLMTAQAAEAMPVRLPPVVPAQLPADVSAFTGRAAELAELDRLLDPASQAPAAGSPAVVISAVAGTAGVGKTALAVHWAHRVRAAFPDGQLYVNLRGFDQEQPVRPADALDGMLRTLGLTGEKIPARLDDRAAQYRSMLDGRRILVVLDNAATAEQIRPLLPGSGGCAVLVTSRDSLAGLVARDGARRVELGVLPDGDAIGLLRALIGARVDAEPGAAARLSAQCARLPLALRVAAELAAARPELTIARLSDELADERRRLDRLDAGGDPRASVRAVFSSSHRHLPADAASAFRLIGAHPGPDLEAEAVAALCGTTSGQGQALLDTLAGAHLVHRTCPGRYGMHDLLRAYAVRLSAAEDDPGVRRMALTRLLDHYLGVAAASVDVLFPAEHDRRRLPVAVVSATQVTCTDTARSWLNAERATLTAATTYAAVHGWPGHAISLAAVLFTYLHSGGHYADAITVCAAARDAASAAADPGSEANALSNLGIISVRQGAYDQATSYGKRAIALLRKTDDRAGQARAWGILGSVEWRRGRYHESVGYLEQALEIYRELGDRIGEARTLNNIGTTEQRLGRFAQARPKHLQALEIYAEAGDRLSQARALNNLGCAESSEGCHREAERYLREALAIHAEIGDQPDKATTLSDLGMVVSRLGSHEQAAEYYTQSVTIFRRLGEGPGEAEALSGLADSLEAMGDRDQARGYRDLARDLRTRLGLPAATADP